MPKRTLIQGIFHNISRAIVRAASSGGSESLHVSADRAEGENAAPNEVESYSGVSIEDIRHAIWDDPIAASSLTIRLLGTFPGGKILPRNESDEAKEVADLIQGITEDMPGSFCGILRDEHLGEALETGLGIAEFVEASITLPEFGDVIGLANIKTKPAESFIEGIIQDVFGNILRFKQTTSSGDVLVEPDRVIYYAHRGTPWNPYGVSIVLPSIGWINTKSSIKTAFEQYSTNIAGGLRIGSIPDQDFDDEWEATLSRMKKLTGEQNLVIPSSYELELLFPPSGVNSQFVEGIARCNKEIRAGILLDELLNAEGQKTGSYSSKKVSQDVVYEAFAAEGRKYCETVAEQLFRQVLIRNGYEGYPIPLLIPDPPQKDAEIDKVLASLAQAYSSGFITEGTPPEVQKQLLATIYDSIGVSYEIDMGGDDGDGGSPGGNAGSATPPPAEAEGKEEKKAGEDPGPPDLKALLDRIPSLREDPGMIAAQSGYPVGRSPSDLMALHIEMKQAEYECQRDLLDKWNEIVPGIIVQITEGLFDENEKLRTRDHYKVKAIIEKGLKYRGKELEKLLAGWYIKRFQAGNKSAAELIEKVTGKKIEGASDIEAGIKVTGNFLEQEEAIRGLRMHASTHLGTVYQDLTDNMVRSISDTIYGYQSERDAAREISALLREDGITPGRASTIVNTSVADAYNRGRLEVFKSSEASVSDQMNGIRTGIKAYQFKALRDLHTTEVCIEYDNKFFGVEDSFMPRPPLHYNCRSVLIPAFVGEDLWGPEPDIVSAEKSQELRARVSKKFDGKFKSVETAPGTTPNAPAMSQHVTITDREGNPVALPDGMSFTGDHDKDDALAYYNNAYKSWERTVSPTDHDYIIDYTNTGFKELDMTLRRGIMPNRGSDLDNMIEALDRLMVDSHIPEDAILFRGGSSSFLEGMIPSEAVGNVITDYAFVSTSVYRGTGFDFMMTSFEKGKVPVLAEIFVPQGRNGMWLANLGKSRVEGEILLPRGSRFRVLSATWVENASIGGKIIPGYWKVAMELI